MLKKSKFAPEHKNVSRVPNGGYTLTSGSNYMLDGFQFDTEYNGGVLEKARLPEAKGLSSLPSGMIPNDSPLFSEIPSHTDDEGGIHLGDFIKEASDQYVPIVDHSWLAKEPKENLEGSRSKKDIYEEMDEGFYSDSALKELESAWSTSTTGLELVPNENRKHPKYTNPERDIDSLPGDDYRANIEKAMRRSAYGEPIRTVVADLKNEMGRRYNESIGEKIASEHGLHGKVYIKEEAFPGIFNGKWDKVIKKRCASAMYIIPNVQDCVYDYHLGRKVVNNINWKKAFETYSPKLKTIGVRLGSGDNYKNRLKSAFLATPPSPIQPQTWFETQEDLTKKYSSEEAQSKFASYKPEETNVGTLRDKEVQNLHNKFMSLASNLVKLGLSTKNQVLRIASSENDYHTKIQSLKVLASKPVLTKTGKYLGSGVNAGTMAGKSFNNDFGHFDTAKQRELAIRSKVAEDKVGRLIKAGLISLDQMEKLACGCGNPEEAVQNALDFIAQNQVDVSNKGYSETKYEQLNLLKEANNDFTDFQKEVSDRLRKNYQAMEEASSHISDKEYDSQQWSEQSKLKQANNNFKAIQQELELRLKQANEMPLLQKEKEVLAVNRKIEATLNSIVSSGLLDRANLEHLVDGVSNPQKKLAKVLNHLTTTQKKEYSDTQYTQHIENKKSSVKLASAESVEKWVRQKMAEGNMGKELDVLLQTKFASEVLDHYGEKIGSLRKAHEGLSGQLYVDAKAYDTPKGVTGCEQGALQHRANTIPAVLEMDKCATCVYKNAEDICQKYNKPIVASVELLGIDNPRKYQKEAIKLANSSDSEKTASLFANNYDANEFSLTTNDEVDIDEEQTPQALADVLFGGFEV